MKICRFDNSRVGIVSDGHVYEITNQLDGLSGFRWPFPHGDQLIVQLENLSERQLGAMTRAPAIPIESVRFDSPVANPSKVIAAPINYADHIAEARADTEIALNRNVKSISDLGLFLKSNTSVVGPSAAIEVRFPERRTDHEAELAVVIGKYADRIPRETALEHVAGYCIGLDMTLRGPELPSWRKSIATYTVLGPWLVTADEVPSPGNLTFHLKVNGQLRQRACTSSMVYDVPRLIEYASSMYPLYPGDVILTGTPEGVGPVKAGDTIDVAFEAIGSMQVQVKNKA